MCRRTIIHHMHHDVRIAITLSTQIDDGQAAPLYAHPYRTANHTCDINVAQSLAHIGLRMEAAAAGGEDAEEEAGKKQLRPCEYHSCCVCQYAVKRCGCSPINVDAVEDLAEPEECADFLLEHRHAPLNVQELVWTQWARVVDRLGDSGSGAVVGLPTALAANPQQQGPSLPKLPEAPPVARSQTRHIWGELAARLPAGQGHVPRLVGLDVRPLGRAPDGPRGGRPRGRGAAAARARGRVRAHGPHGDDVGGRAGRGGLHPERVRVGGYAAALSR
ncbi:uncharacterized protein PG986_011830 [Apiospora aurea]|uniref:Uncharacterized protein n=1 Tax=Apiospora aurea TaxID=335848 RepID=A0ABR1PYA0_9PEZI